MKKPNITIAKPDLKGVSPILFIQQSVAELKKVTWPSRIQTIKLTAIVIAVSTIVGLYIGSLDFIFTKLTEALVK